MKCLFENIFHYIKTEDILNILPFFLFYNRMSSSPPEKTEIEEKYEKQEETPKKQDKKVQFDTETKPEQTNQEEKNKVNITTPTQRAKRANLKSMSPEEIKEHRRAQNAKYNQSDKEKKLKKEQEFEETKRLYRELENELNQLKTSLEYEKMIDIEYLKEKNKSLKKQVEELNIKNKYLKCLNPDVYGIFDFYDDDDIDEYPEQLKDWYENNKDIRDIVEPNFMNEWKEKFGFDYPNYPKYDEEEDPFVQKKIQPVVLEESNDELEETQEENEFHSLKEFDDEDIEISLSNLNIEKKY